MRRCPGTSAGERHSRQHGTTSSYSGEHHRRDGLAQDRGSVVAPVHHLPAPPPRRARRPDPRKALREQLAVRYVKVTEYQARGVVHFHAVIRLDQQGDTYQPPDPSWTADLLCEAIGQAAAAVVLAVAPEPGQAVRALTFGPQTDTRPVRPGPALPATGTALPGQAVANYIAKIRHQDPHRHRSPGAAHQAAGRHRPSGLPPALQADDDHRLAAH